MKSYCSGKTVTFFRTTVYFLSAFSAFVTPNKYCTKLNTCSMHLFQDGSEKSRGKSPHGTLASLVRFVRQLVGQADGFVTCIALLVAGLAVSYTGVCRMSYTSVCRNRQKTSHAEPSQDDSVPPSKKKLT